MSLLRRQLLGATALAGFARAHGQESDWPSRPLRLIVVYPPGGVSDLMARALAEPLAEALDVPVLVEHRPGAGGSIGIDALARAAPDGYTLAFSAISPLTLHPLIARLARDRLHAVDPVVSVMRTPVLVVGTPAFQGRRFEDAITQARQHPGELRWASSGIATTGHLVLAQVRALAGVEITHIPYQGGGPQLNDALGGQFEILSTNVAVQQLRYIEEGRLRALAVGAPRRLAASPPCRACRPWPSSASRQPTVIRCSACSRRPARRRRWWPGSMPRSTACCAARRCVRAWHRRTTWRPAAARRTSRARSRWTGAGARRWWRRIRAPSTEGAPWEWQSALGRTEPLIYS